MILSPVSCFCRIPSIRNEPHDHKRWAKTPGNQVPPPKGKVLRDKGNILHQPVAEKAEKELSVNRKREMKLFESDFVRETKRLKNNNNDYPNLFFSPLIPRLWPTSYPMTPTGDTNPAMMISK